MKKRFGIWALALCLVLITLPARAWAAAGGGSGLTWSYDQSTKTATVSGTGTIGAQDVAAFLNQYPTPIDTLIIRDGVTAIEDDAFNGSSWSISNIIIAGSVKSIGARAFNGGSSLRSVTISGDGVKIGRDAFNDCLSLASVTFSGSVDSIGEYAFYNCFSLTSLAFPDGVDSIESGAFLNCHDLASVTFSGGVGTIGPWAFSSCGSLASVTFSGDVGAIGDQAFYQCGGLTSLTFPGSVGSIGEEAFFWCDNLASLTFAGSLSSVGRRAFYECNSLTSLELPEGLTSVGEEAFLDCDSLLRLYLPGTVKAIGDDPFGYSRELRDVYFGGTAGQWDALGGSKIFGSLSNPVPVCHPNASGLPDTEAGDFQTLKQLISNGVGAGRTDIELTADLTGLTETLTIPKDCVAVLDLKGHRIASSASPVIDVQGNLTVLDSTVTGAPTVENNTVSYASGCIEATAGDAVYVRPFCTFTLLEGTIKAQGRAVIVYGSQDPNNSTKFQMDSGYVEAEGSAVTALGEGAWANIDSGVFLSKDAPVMSSGKEEERGNPSFSISRATLIAKSSTPGTLPCGIYQPQEGSLDFYGVQIHAEGGVGVLLRNGSLTVRDTRDQATRIYAGGSGQGVIGSGDPLSAGQRIVMDQKSEFPGSNYIRVNLAQTLQYKEELKPNAYPADGYSVRFAQTPNLKMDAYSFSYPHTVTFRANGGTGNAVRTTDADGKIEWPADPVWEGYVFRGWASLQQEPLLHIVDPETKIFDFDTILYAAWIPKGTYVVSFRISDQISWNSEVKVTTIDGVLLDWPPAPINFGTVFQGWFLDPNGGTEYPFDQPFTKDTTLYAHLGSLARPHTVTFHLNDGTGGTDKRTTGMNGVLADWPGDPTREGYVFWGWSRSSDYSIWLGKDYEFYADADLYARWIPEDGFAVTFHPNNGTDDETRNTNTGGSLNKWPNDPVLTGYTFGGWYADPKPPAGVYTASSTAFQRDTDLYAHWIKIGGGDEPGDQTYTITFNANGGIGSVSLTTGSDGRLSALPAVNPTRTGYTFNGWYTAASGGSRVTTSTRFKEDTTVYAHWAQNSTTPADKTYTITFNPNGGTGGGSLATGTDGRLAALPGSPVRTGYTFAGWYTDPSGGTQVTTSTVFQGHATVYAHWSQSSGTPSAAYYQVYTPGVIYGGSFTVSHSYAVPGTLVTVTSSPWSGYELNQLSAIRADTGRQVYLAGNYSNQYTFVMPDSDVQLIGAFVQTYIGTVNPGYPGTVSPSYPGTSTGSGNSGYVDVSAVTKPVNWYFSGGHIYHVTDGLVPTGTALTRDMLVSVLYNMDSSSSGQPTIWAAENDIVPDIYQSGLWGPDKSISREQAAMILFCYAQHKGYATNQTARLTGYRDYSQMRSIARPAMSWCQAVGLITATSARTLSPQAILTCGEANTILNRFVSGVASGW